MSCLDILNQIIVANNSKSELFIFVTFQTLFPSFMLRSVNKLGPLHDLSKVFMHHLSLCLSPPRTQPNATDSAVGIIISPSELDIVTKSYSCNRLSGLENKFWSWHGVFVNTVQKHRFRTMFNQICWQTMFALVCIRLYNTENSLTKRSTPHMPTQCNPKHPQTIFLLVRLSFLRTATPVGLWTNQTLYRLC